MLLGRLRVRQKLVLLVLPLLLLVVVGAVPLVLRRVQAAERSSDSAKLVQRAVRITELVQELQQERLASLGYLSNDVEPGTGGGPVDPGARAGPPDVHRLRRRRRQARPRAAPGDPAVRAGRAPPQVLEQRATGLGVYTGFTGDHRRIVDQLRLTDGRRPAHQHRPQAGRARRDHPARRGHRGRAARRCSSSPGGGSPCAWSASSAAGSRWRTARRPSSSSWPTPAPPTCTSEVEASRSSSRLNNYLDGLVGSNAAQISATIAGDLAPQVGSLTSLSRLVETRVAAQAVAEADRSARTDRWLAGIVGGVALVLLIGAGAAVGADHPLDRAAAAPAHRVRGRGRRRRPAGAGPGRRHRGPGGRGAAAAAGPGRHGRRARRAGPGVQPGAAGRRQTWWSGSWSAGSNVATMFGNVGRRTQNLVGRQLAMIDSLERNEQDPALLDRLYRLDHVSTRLRRNANSLVVLSGAAEQQITGEPLSVADTIRSALGEIEGFQRVRLGSVERGAAHADRHRRRDPAARRAAGERHLVLAAAHRGRGRGAVGRRQRRADPDRRPRARHDARAAGGGERAAGLPGAARPGADRRARAVRGRAAGPAARDRRAAHGDAG